MKLIDKITDVKKLSKLLAMRDLGDGIIGELFEAHIHMSLENSEHLGMKKNKCDVKIDGEEFSCKVTTNNQRNIKIHNLGIDTNELKKMNKKQLSKVIKRHIPDIKFIILSADSCNATTSISNISNFISKIDECRFTVKNNKKSVSLSTDCGLINITNRSIFLSKLSLEDEQSSTFEIKKYSPYSLVERMLSEDN